MKLTGIFIMKYNGPEAQPTTLGSAIDVSNFGYFQRPAVREGIMFVVRTIVQRTQPGQRQSVKNDDYMCHVYVKADAPIAAAVMVDSEYPVIAAFSIVHKVLDEFLQKHGDSWQNAQGDVQLEDAVLTASLPRYQDPTQVDKLCKIQKDLDETKIVLHKTIESVLRRGEVLDNLVDKSNDLSLASQMFYKQARKTNSCCRFM